MDCEEGLVKEVADGRDVVTLAEEAGSPAVEHIVEGPDAATSSGINPGIAELALLLVLGAGIAGTAVEVVEAVVSKGCGRWTAAVVRGGLAPRCCKGCGPVATQGSF